MGTHVPPWHTQAGPGPGADGDGCCYFLVIVLVLTALFSIPSGFVVRGATRARPKARLRWSRSSALPTPGWGAHPHGAGDEAGESTGLLRGLCTYRQKREKPSPYRQLSDQIGYVFRFLFSIFLGAKLAYRLLRAARVLASSSASSRATPRASCRFWF